MCMGQLGGIGMMWLRAGEERPGVISGRSTHAKPREQGDREERKAWSVLIVGSGLGEGETRHDKSVLWSEGGQCV